jgi:hypothetical protein
MAQDTQADEIDVDTIAPTTPTAVTFTATGGTETPDYVNATNLNFTGGATITAGQATDGSAEWLIGGISFTTPITDDTILVGDGTVVFNAGLDNNGDVQTQIAAGEKVLSINLCDAAGNCTTSEVGENKTINADYTAPTATILPTAADGPIINAAEKSDGVDVIIGLGTSDALEGDTIELLIEGEVFTDIAQTYTLSSGEISGGSYTFTVASGADTVDWAAVYAQAVTTIDAVADADIVADVAAFSNQLDDEITTKVLPRFRRGMQDINAVVSSAFVIGEAVIEGFRDRDVAKHSSAIRLNLSSQQSQQNLEASKQMLSLMKQRISW